MKPQYKKRTKGPMSSNSNSTSSYEKKTEIHIYVICVWLKMAPRKDGLQNEIKADMSTRTKNLVID